MNITIDLPESIFSALRKALPEFVQEMRVAAAAKWYEMALLRFLTTHFTGLTDRIASPATQCLPPGKSFHLPEKVETIVVEAFTLNPFKPTHKTVLLWAIL